MCVNKQKCGPLLVIVSLLLLPVPSWVHPDQSAISIQVNDWLANLQESEIRDSNTALFAFDDSKRMQFTWLPGRRAGVRLDELNEQQQRDLRNIFLQVLSTGGANKIDAIIATEAALAIISNAPDYRNPGKYYTAVFGKPGAGPWGLRFEGHHLSVNLTFIGDRLVSATPLFLGANPEIIPVGPDKGLRALKDEVDLARSLVDSLSDEQKKIASARDEWFAGFLSNPGERRAQVGKPVGILASELNPNQQDLLLQLISAYVKTIHQSFADAYLQQEVKARWATARFFWKGSNENKDNYYYRITSGNLLIEQETQGKDSHIHAIWRDAAKDFGGTL